MPEPRFAPPQTPAPQTLPQPREFTLGIIGGCMSHQRDVPFNDLYHRRLAAMLLEDPGVRLRVRVARDFTLPYAERLERLLADRSVDGVMVHIRTVTLMAHARFFRRSQTGSGRRFALNPVLLDRRHRRAFSAPEPAAARPKPHGPDAYSFNSGETYSSDAPPPGRRIAGLRIRSVNAALGALAGLDRWAVEEEMTRFADLAAACAQRGLPLFVLGPPPSPESRWNARVVRRANNLIRRRLSGTNIGFALLEPGPETADRPFTMRDGVHLTPDGHRFVAERLYRQGMREWVGR
jgi:hypothetical protein